MKTIASSLTLMQLANELGRAKKGGNRAEITKAQKAHDDYRNICLKVDELNLGVIAGSLM